MLHPSAATRNKLAGRKRAAQRLLAGDKGPYLQSHALYCEIALLELIPAPERDVQTIAYMTELNKTTYDQFGRMHNPGDYRLYQVDDLMQLLRQEGHERRLPS